MLTATFYTDHSARPCANSHSFAWNNRHYHGLFGASNHYGLGTRVVLSSRSGRRVTITIADRTDGRTDYDVTPQVLKMLAGNHWRKVGRIAVRAGREGK